jgi:hypothetical protein
MSFGSSSRPRAISSSFCWPPEKRRGLGARLFAQHRKALEHRLDAPGGVGLAPGRGQAELEVVQHGELREHVAPLRHVGDAELEQAARLAMGDFNPVERDAAAPHRQQPEHRLEDGGLAGAVRTDDGGDRPARHLEAGLVEHRQLAVAANQPFEREDVSVQGRSR